MPPHQTIMHKCQPVYEELEGWEEDIGSINKFNELPLEAKSYISRIEEIIKIPVSMISVGAERKKIIIKDKNLKRRLLKREKNPTTVV